MLEKMDSVVGDSLCIRRYIRFTPAKIFCAIRAFHCHRAAWHVHLKPAAGVFTVKIDLTLALGGPLRGFTIDGDKRFVRIDAFPVIGAITVILEHEIITGELFIELHSVA